MVSFVIFHLHSSTLTIFIILLMLCTSNGDDVKFKTCSSSLVSCGNLTKVGYPFWGYDRPRYCGHPALQLHCIDNMDPVLNIGDDGAGVYYSVNGITSSSEESQMTIRLHQYFPMTCPFQSFNRVFNEIFQLREDYVNITLFYNCPSQYMVGYLNCSIACRDNISTTYYLKSKLQAEPFTICQTIEVPVPSNELQYVYIETLDILHNGFEVHYRYSSACSNCQNSGGVCGSQDAEFACFHRKSGQWKDWKLIVGIAILGAFILIATGIARLFCLRKKESNLKFSFLWKAEAKKYQNIDAFLKIYGSLAPKRYTYAMLRNMTNGFNEKLGEGGYAIVYKGKLVNGRLVAVKILKQSKGNGRTSLMRLLAFVELIMSIL